MLDDIEYKESSHAPNQTNHTAVAVLLLAVLSPAIIAFGILYKQAAPAPYIDDYNALLSFGSKYVRLPTLEAKVIAVATERHNEYKLGFEHAIAAAELEVTHHLDFAFLTVLGDLFLLPIAYLLWLTYKTDRIALDRRLWEFLPISLAFFSLTYWETLNWAMAGLQVLPVICFSLLALHLVTPRTNCDPSPAHFLCGCMAALLASFSSANGFFLAPIGLLIFLPRKAYGQAFVWCLSFVAPCSAYLYHRIPSQNGLTKPSFIKMPFFFLRFLGSVFYQHWGATRLLSLLLGLLILAILVMAVRTRFDRVNPVACCFALWIVVTAALAGWVRGGSGLVVTSRYSIYSNLLLIFSYVFITHHLRNRWQVTSLKRLAVNCVAIASFGCLLVDAGAYSKLKQRRATIFTGLESYRASPDRNSPLSSADEQIFPGEKEFERSTLTTAIRAHVYCLPAKEQ